MKISRRSFTQTSLAALTVVASPVALAQNGLTVKDLAGRNVHFKKRPMRFAVAGYLPNFMMVAGSSGVDRLVGITLDGWEAMRQAEYRAYTEAFPQLKRLPSIGGYHDAVINSEKVIALRPDVLVCDVLQYRANAQRLELLEKAGIAVVVLDYHSMVWASHEQSTKILGQLLGREAQAEAMCARYAQVMATIDERLASVPERQKHRRVYVECGNVGVDRYGNSYNKTFLWGGILEQLQAHNIARDMKTAYGELTREYVITQNPQVIVIAGSIWINANENDQMRMGLSVTDEDAQRRLLGYARRDQWQRLQAVKDGAVYAVDHGSLRSMMDYVFFMYLARVLYPQTFADFDAEAEIQAFYRTYLPQLNASGTFVMQLKKK